jgi:NAD(P)-dependent dehydrogenase (short-subunit alcohol dehydrogenase family)
VVNVTNTNPARTYVILGANGGIGSAVARRLAGGGHRLALAGRSRDAIEATASPLGANPFAADVADPDAVDRLFADIGERIGPVAGAVNCVGSVLLKPAHLTSTDEWAGTLQANLTSAFALVRAAGRHMREQGGSVVLISSAAARVGLPNHEAIAAAKAGVTGLARSAAATYAKAGLRFNVVAPGLVRTSATERIWRHETAADASRAMHALGRLGEPDDVARAITWLLEPEQDWITGQVLGVDGGLADVKLR